ncbi:MAG: 5-deoxy-glucuronate isomerase [Firmicutes bacterium]|nr:5-deoxy-glucuronate isomerase [Bacillota bacterium]
MILKYSPNRGRESMTAIVEANPDTAPLHYVGASVYQLKSGDRWTVRNDSLHEGALVLLTGQGVVSGDRLAKTMLVSRSSVFDDAPPYVVYVGSGEGLVFHAETACELVWATALLNEPFLIPTTVYKPDDMNREERGEGVTRREVRHLLDSAGQAVRLQVVEVLTPGGHWSSFPPHKHDREVPNVESFLEELYYYHLTPESWWAFQRIYDDNGWGETLDVHDGDLVVVPRGYHPVAVPPGGAAYYLNVMAGPTRNWHVTVDPTFRQVGRLVASTEGGQKSSAK